MREAISSFLDCISIILNSPQLTFNDIEPPLSSKQTHLSLSSRTVNRPKHFGGSAGYPEYLSHSPPTHILPEAFASHIQFLL